MGRATCPTCPDGGAMPQPRAIWDEANQTEILIDPPKEGGRPRGPTGAEAVRYRLSTFGKLVLFGLPVAVIVMLFAIDVRWGGLAMWAIFALLPATIVLGMVAMAVMEVARTLRDLYRTQGWFAPTSGICWYFILCPSIVLFMTAGVVAVDGSVGWRAVVNLLAMIGFGTALYGVYLYIGYACRQITKGPKP